MTQNSNNNSNETTAKIKELRNVCFDNYWLGCLDAQASFLDFVDDLISNIDIAEYDEYKDDYSSFDEFVMQYTADLFMWNSDAITFICDQFDEDAADTLDEVDVNPFRDPNCFACMLFEHMLYQYVDFEKLEAYVRQQA